LPARPNSCKSATVAQSKRLQRPPSADEARISIIKHVFLGGRARSKGFAHRELRVTWSVLVHNLWVLARRQQPDKAADAQPQAA
jgi:hypothetical protein